FLLLYPAKLHRSGTGVPDLDRPVHAGARDLRAVGTERRGLGSLYREFGVVSAKAQCLLTGGDIPENDPVQGNGEESLAVGAEGEAENHVVVARECADLLARRRLPESDAAADGLAGRRFVTGGGGQFAVGAEDGVAEVSSSVAQHLRVGRNGQIP